MILITGAGGKTGRALVKNLSKVENICVLVHRDEHVPMIKTLGAEKVIVGDMCDERVIRSVMQGMRAVYHVCPNMHPDEMTMAQLTIRAARESAVDRFIYHSVLHPQIEKMTHHWQKLRVEEMIFESGLSFTILQPAPYMQNLLAGWKNVEAGKLRVPYSIHARFSFVDLADVADAARIVLTEPNHINAVYELSGTAPTSHAEVAEIASRVLGREVKAEKEEIRDWRLRAQGVNEYAVENLVKMFEYYDQWGLMGNPNVLSWLLKRKPTSLESFLQRSVYPSDGE